jgi:hypothetical protein
MSDWGDFFKIQFELDDNKKQAQKDTERINSMINALEKKQIPLDIKRRKGRILKELRRNMRGWSESTRYTRLAIRYAINEIRMQEWGVL